MTSYLAPRSSQRPASATLQRRVQLSTSRAKTFASHSKSVRFEDTPKSKSRRSMSTKESKFHFPWKKRKDEGRMKSNEAMFSSSVCDSPSSVRSAPSTVGHSVTRGKRVYSPVHSVDGNEMRCRSPANSDTTNADDVYDLYAVCNHMGTMTRGHYTAFCRNPADGHWYMYDDNHVQSLPEEQLVTAGAYLLFYVRQSLLHQLPPLSSTSSSSSSSAGSSHWAAHIPQFRLDLGESVSSSQGPYSSNTNEVKTSRSRFGSAPPISVPNSRGFSPQSSIQDYESDVFTQSRGGADNQSAVSLPSSNATPLHRHQLSSPSHQPPFSNDTHLSKARHASLRINRPRQFSPESPIHANEQFMRRGTSFHTSHQHQAVHRSLTDSGRVFPHSGQGLVMPSRSIPNITGADYAAGTSNFPVPSRSIPDLCAHMSPPPPANFPHDHTQHFMTPQPHRARTFSAGLNYAKSGTESCV